MPEEIQELVRTLLLDTVNEDNEAKYTVLTIPHFEYGNSHFPLSHWLMHFGAKKGETIIITNVCY